MRGMLSGRRALVACGLVALGLLPGAGLAWELQGSKTLTLHARDGQSLTLGRVSFEPQPGGAVRFALSFEDGLLKDHFLSMREFKCLEGQGEVLCHVPYPYAQPGTVSAQDYAWLEHALLFLYKKPGEFGAKLWNGLYFRFEATPTGLVGRPQAVDLNAISAPPTSARPPYGPALRDDIAEGARWVSRLTIE